MVEKIIVNPTKTRAYGNIIGAKDSTDYDTYNAYITEITDTVYGSTSNVFSMEVAPHIGLTATNPYMVSGETTDLVVSLVNAFGSPLSGETVTLSDGTSVYTGITNNQGTYTKTGVSVNSITAFTASYKNVNSNEVTVYPTIFRDYATSDNKSNYYINGAGGTTLTWSNGYYVLGLGSSSNYVDLKSITDNVKGKTVNFKVDVVLNGASIRLRVFNGSTVLANSAYTTSDGTVKIENVAIPSDATSILFRLERRYLTDGDSIKFKNFVIY